VRHRLGHDVWIRDRGKIAAREGNRAGAEAAAADAGEMFGALMSAGLSLARERGFDVAVIGLAERNPLVEVVRRRWKTREYRSLLNVVQWPGRGEYVADGAARVAHPEIALM